MGRCLANLHPSDAGLGMFTSTAEVWGAWSCWCLRRSSCTSAKELPRQALGVAVPAPLPCTILFLPSPSTGLVH